MSERKREPPERALRVLVVTPGVTLSSAATGLTDNYLLAKAAGITDASAHLTAALARTPGLEVHVAFPKYRLAHKDGNKSLVDADMRVYEQSMESNHIHPVEHPYFDYGSIRGAGASEENAHIGFSLEQRVLSDIIPRVDPDIVHCNGWTTGIIPPATRSKGKRCLLSLYQFDMFRATLRAMASADISVQDFWRHLYFERMPQSYEDAREHNTVDLMASAIFGAHFIHTGSDATLHEIVSGRHGFIPSHIVAEIANKVRALCARGIPLPTDPERNPKTDSFLACNFGSEHPAHGKCRNKRALQKRLELDQTDSAPLFFFPSEVDDKHKGCHLLVEALYEMVSRFRAGNLQVVVVASGAYQRHLRVLVALHGLSRRVAVRDFDPELAQLAFAASDFLLVPSSFEPFGLTAVTGMTYGSLPVAYDTGGLHDAITPLHPERDSGNGILFSDYAADGLLRGVEEAMAFHRLPAEVRESQVGRIMAEAEETYSSVRVAAAYVKLYDAMMNLPLAVSF